MVNRGVLSGILPCGAVMTAVVYNSMDAFEAVRNLCLHVYVENREKNFHKRARKFIKALLSPDRARSVGLK